MTKDDERYWIPLAATGDTAAIDFVLAEYIGFAWMIAKRYQGSEGWCDVDDLFQEARMGQLEAIDTWDPDGGAGFCAWSALYMKNHVFRFLHFHRAVCERASAPVRSLDEPFCGDGERIADHIVDGHIQHQLDRMITWEPLERLPELMKALPPQEYQIVTERFGLTGEIALTNQQVADQISAATGRPFSRQRVSQIEHCALGRMRRMALKDPRWAEMLRG